MGQQKYDAAILGAGGMSFHSIYRPACRARYYLPLPNEVDTQ